MITSGGLPKGIPDNQLLKASKLPPHKLGAWFEGQTQDRLKWFQENKHLMFHRFPDSKSAGNIIAAQPSDYLVGSPLAAWLVEVKASKVHKSLRSCAANAIRQEQVVKAHLWMRSGLRSVFIFISVTGGVIEVWDGRHVVAQRFEGKPLNPSKGVLLCCEPAGYTDTLNALFF